MFYKKCPTCGSNNDPGETCDCIKKVHEINNKNNNKSKIKKKNNSSKKIAIAATLK